MVKSTPGEGGSSSGYSMARANPPILNCIQLPIHLFYLNRKLKTENRKWYYLGDSRITPTLTMAFSMPSRVSRDCSPWAWAMRANRASRMDI
jgi:hypothetical protein